jgi:hypothetical protein
MSGPRGTTPLANKMPRVSNLFVHVPHTHSPMCLPNCQLNTDTSTLATSSATCESYPAMSACTNCTVNIFFFPVWKIEQIAISHSSDVRLTPFEVRWVHDDEGYTPVHFEVIPNTFIFGLNFDPWSRF